jgi:uncharacterized protein YjbI with pentapeptide repeats
MGREPGGAQLDDADLRSVTLVEADLRGADLGGANFSTPP